MFWSSVDLEQITKYNREGCRIVATVFNKHGEMRTSYQQGPSRDGLYPPLFVDDLPTEVVPDKECAKLITELVTQKKFRTSKRKKLLRPNDLLKPNAPEIYKDFEGLDNLRASLGLKTKCNQTTQEVVDEFIYMAAEIHGVDVGVEMATDIHWECAEIIDDPTADELMEHFEDEYLEEMMKNE